MATKTVFKFFLITDFEKEEKYLMDMHRKGWKLEKISFNYFYHFVATEPEAVIYQLDFKDNGRV